MLDSKRKAMVAAAVFALSAWISISGASFPNGTGDASIGYGGCAVSGCHFGATREGNATIEMWASNQTLFVDQIVTIYVNVTSWVLSSNKMMGIFLLRSLTADDSDVPSSDGWRILTDPNGGTHNYVQTTIESPGETASLRWEIRAPFSSGTYSLFARVHHGGGSPYWEENSTGLLFQVLPLVGIKPDLELVSVFYLTQPQAGKEVILYANIYNNFSEDIEGLDINFFINGIIVAEKQNQTLVANEYRNVTVVWVPQEAGNITLKVVIDPEDSFDETNESNNELTLSVVISEAEFHPSPPLMILGILALVLVLFISAVAVLGLRKGKKDEAG